MVADKCHKDLFNYRFNKKNLNFRYRVLSKEVLDIQATIECGFNLKRLRDMIGTYNQMHRTDTYPQHSSIFWPVCLNGWLLVYELSGCEFQFRYTWTSDIAPVSSKEFLDNQATIMCGFTHIIKCTVQISTHSTAQLLGQFG